MSDKKDFSVDKDPTEAICISLRKSVLEKIQALTARAKEKNPKVSLSSVVNQLLAEKVTEFKL